MIEQILGGFNAAQFEELGNTRADAANIHHRTFNFCHTAMLNGAAHGRQRGKSSGMWSEFRGCVRHEQFAHVNCE
jgi:hypothetical protein